MEDGFTSKQTKTSTKSVNGVSTKVTETILKKPDGTTKTITETVVTQTDGSTSTSTNTKTEHGAPASGGDASSQAAPPSKGTAVSAGDLGGFRQESLKAHNSRRAKHGVPALTMADDLNTYAQKWADHLVATGSLAHSDCTHQGGRLGENVAYCWASGPGGADYTGEAVTEQWYSEISKHDYNKDHQPGTGHFTQVVWKGTQEMGIGKGKASDGKCFVVGSYRPAGNMMGSWAQNVFPPK